MGIIIYEMLHQIGFYPYGNRRHASKLETHQAIAKAAASGFEFSALLSWPARSFVLRHLKLEPKERPDMDQLLADVWIVDKA